MVLLVATPTVLIQFPSSIVRTNPAAETSRAVHLLQRWRFVLAGVGDTPGARRERYIRRCEGDKKTSTIKPAGKCSAEGLRPCRAIIDRAVEG